MLKLVFFFWVAAMGGFQPWGALKYFLLRLTMPN